MAWNGEVPNIQGSRRQSKIGSPLQTTLVLLLPTANIKGSHGKNLQDTWGRSCEGLNKELLQEQPDMTNQLIGVLLRFREKHVAVMADIESMFYQVNVPEKHKDYLQFVWWPGWWRSVEGANRSPDESASIWCIIFTQLLQLCATKTADLYTNQFGEETAHALTRHSYVDDILKSYNKSQNAINATPKVVGMLAAGGLKLTKFHSNGRKTLATIPDGDRSKQLKDVDISTCMIPVERALGMNWCFESDKFTFKIQLKDKPMTRRGILSTISSIYDPFGIAIPYLFEWKKILQQICAEKGWDDPLTNRQINSWVKRKLDIKLLENFCFCSSN